MKLFLRIHVYLAGLSACASRDYSFQYKKNNCDLESNNYLISLSTFTVSSTDDRIRENGAKNEETNTEPVDTQKSLDQSIFPQLLRTVEQYYGLKKHRKVCGSCQAKQIVSFFQNSIEKVNLTAVLVSKMSINSIRKFGMLQTKIEALNKKKCRKLFEEIWIGLKEELTYLEKQISLSKKIFIAPLLDKFFIILEGYAGINYYRDINEVKKLFIRLRNLQNELQNIAIIYYDEGQKYWYNEPKWFCNEEFINLVSDLNKSMQHIWHTKNTFEPLIQPFNRELHHYNSVHVSRYSFICKELLKEIEDHFLSPFLWMLIDIIVSFQLDVSYMTVYKIIKCYSAGIKKFNDSLLHNIFYDIFAAKLEHLDINSMDDKYERQLFLKKDVFTLAIPCVRYIIIEKLKILEIKKIVWISASGNEILQEIPFSQFENIYC